MVSSSNTITTIGFTGPMKNSKHGKYFVLEKLK
jgi:hypothetical protein